MIELKGLSKRYTVSGTVIQALRPLDLTIGEGEFVSIVGHSGSGKSTLLSLVGGIARPDTGAVHVAGKDLHALEDAALARLRNELFGFVYQFPSLIPTLNAVENVLLPTAFGARRTEEHAVALLGQVGLGDKVARYPAQLSGGEQQRVAIARAFVHDPRILLADEPTGDLDEETEAEIMSFFERMNRERGVTTVMVTHSSDLALRARVRLRMKLGAVERLA
jgi:putative ABC transport system ATP-binding protein/lipoprotein-releasing system ATP-binding protein